ncbi:MAG TPA: T9SS type A sorting domain-containing protein [Bacteroidia bacterium]|nr:T9SS type A sorting domain-containing protein [Bacteroidia bacterium]
MKKALFIISLCCTSYFSFGQWDSVGSGIGINGYEPFAVLAMQEYNGNLYVGGTFTVAGSKTDTAIAIWNGTNWSAFANGLGGKYTTVEAFTIYNGSLCVGGYFTTAGGKVANNIAMWNGTTWSTLGSGIKGTVYSLAVFNGNLYAGGIFDSADGKPVHDITMWNGSTWSDVGGGVVQSGSGYPISIYSMIVYNNNLYIGGSFDTVGNQPINNIAMWNGSTWSAVGGGVGNPNESQIGVYTMAIWNGNLYVGGAFDTVGGKAIGAIAEWNGVTWLGLGKSNYAYDGVSTITVYNSNLYVAGTFLGSIGGIQANNIAEWNGTVWSPLGSGVSFYPDSGGVDVIAPYGGYLYAGGGFHEAGSINVRNIARWSSPTGINELSQSNSLNVYPNPSNGIFNVELKPNSEKLKIEVYNMMGEKLQEQLTVDNAQLTINLSGEPNGIYLYRLIDNSGNAVATGRLAVQR